MATFDRIADYERKGAEEAAKGPPAPPAAREPADRGVLAWLPKREEGIEDVNRRDRYRGAMLGLAVGDMVGTAIENPHLPEGAWSDDTSLALCLAASLIERGGVDPRDQLARYAGYITDGYQSCLKGYCLAGMTTRMAVRAFLVEGRVEATLTAYEATNGSLMRLAPVVLAYAGLPEREGRAIQSSRTTHNNVEACEACLLLSDFIETLLLGGSKSDALDIDPTGWSSRRVAEIAGGSYAHYDPPRIKGSMLVTDTLERALWAFDGSSDFEDGLQRVMNLGGDVDTVGAVYGQLAGAYYGLDGIPARWRERVAWDDYITAVADRLLELSERLGSASGRSGTSRSPASTAATTTRTAPR